MVYLLFDEYLKRENKNYIFYVAVSLILLKESVIFDIMKNDSDELMLFFNKKIKNLNKESDI